MNLTDLEALRQLQHAHDTVTPWQLLGTWLPLLGLIELGLALSFCGLMASSAKAVADFATDIESSRHKKRTARAEFDLAMATITPLHVHRVVSGVFHTVVLVLFLALLVHAGTSDTVHPRPTAGFVTVALLIIMVLLGCSCSMCKPVSSGSDIDA